MKTKDLVTITSVALATATLTVLTFWSPSLEAGNEGEVPAAKIAKPKLVSHGIELTLAAAGGQTFQAGDEPVFELKAVNPTEAPATVTVRVAMTGAAPEDRMSRMIRLPSVLWQQPCTLALKPLETKVVTLSTQTKLPANTQVSVALQDADLLPNKGAAAGRESLSLLLPAASSSASIIAMNFSTVPPATKQALVQ